MLFYTSCGEAIGYPFNCEWKHLGHSTYKHKYSKHRQCDGKWESIMENSWFLNSGSIWPLQDMHYSLISVFVTCQKIENKEPISCGLFSFILLEIKAELSYKKNSWCVYKAGRRKKPINKHFYKNSNHWTCKTRTAGMHNQEHYKNFILYETFLFWHLFFQYTV